jgi:hypothetical protein
VDVVKLFGTTIKETVDAFRGAHLGGKKGAKNQAEDKAKAVIRIVISFLLLTAGVFFFGYNHGNSRTIGATIIGAITGYWLK